MLKQVQPRPADPYGYRALLSIALPLIATVGCFSVTLFTDRVLLMWYGPTSSAASISAGNVYWAIACIPVTAMGFTTPLVAAAMGRGLKTSDSESQPHQRNVDKIPGLVWKLIWQSIWITFATLPLFALIGWLSPTLFLAFDHDPNLAAEEATYFRTLLLVAPASMLEAGLTAFFVGRRKTGPIFRTNVASAVLNIFLDVWLIFGGAGVPALGVLGAALATAIAMWFKAAIFAVLIVRSSPSIRSLVEHYRPNRLVIGRILGPGSVLGIQQLIRSSMFSYLMLMIGTASVTGLAATSAAVSLYQLLSIPAVGLATAVTVMIGQSHTSATIHLVRAVVRRSLVFSAGVSLLVVAPLVSFPHWIVEIPLYGVSKDEADAVRPIAIFLLRFAAAYGVFDITALTLGAVLKGLGTTTPILISTLFASIAALTFGWFGGYASVSQVTHWWSALVIWAATQTICLAVFLVKRGSLARPHG
ncbi:MATE family efflux transporter [Roseiconus lacunae]|uniref:MATE family efflux transporter n=1 Tax=Roseiconus lacunae TaxID=2605694 RepID=UPI0011F2B8F4|nr:MATE family efflux transporter [Roseiconus lacunae]